MLQIKNISKEYVTGDLHQTALDKVSLNLRDNEFVSILGPSGSGKTTLLNIIGGLDRYDSGDLIINEISTKNYKDRDWDSYRNHTIGFVFQSYNLIPHQSILSNVELALTISGISRKERRKKAKKALEDVGLGNQLHKKPNQMSGGQMQRVAIARALVNNPDILLADEPTGALDTETSVQVMELLKNVAKDRLVVMVTHNPELAATYSNRIVKLCDGKIIDDSNPFEVNENLIDKIVNKNMGKSSMSVFTSLSLSFNNLWTKKARTLLTSFAGSIGIIGIALILALSTGVNTYIDDIQKSTMASYPVTIESQTIDLTTIMMENSKVAADVEVNHKLNGVYSNGKTLEMASNVTTSITKNNLTEFKKFLEDENSGVQQYVGENGIVYSYNTNFNVFTYDENKTLVNTDGSTLTKESESLNMINSAVMSNSTGFSTSMTGNSSNFDELIPGQKGKLISSAVTDNYTVLHGSWPKEFNEIVLVLDKNNEISSTVLYQLGILPTKEYKKIEKKIQEGKDVALKSKHWKYSEICEKEFYLIPACDTFEEKDDETFVDISNDEDKIKKIIKKAVKLKICGVVKPNSDTDNLTINGTVGYTKKLTDYVIEYTNKSDVVKAQKSNKKVNVLNGLKFSPKKDSVKIEDTKTYLTNLGVSEKAQMCKTLMKASGADEQTMQHLSALDETQLALMLDNYLQNPDDEALLQIYDNYISAGSYDENMTNFGYVSLDAPSAINIYTDSFEDKDFISQAIDDYNKTATEENQITYIDYVGLLMSSVTTIIDVISYVLIAFVAVSLIVSSIMIGIITYISVLERTKEIGILRAIGASKKNISQVFNAETFIIGLCSGILGVGVSWLAIIPINIIVHKLTGIETVNAILPIDSAVVLIILSVILTLIGGLIPAKKAAKKDPVTALRSE